jgi:hypothetical protein
MTYTKGHKSYKPIVNGVKTVTWKCEVCDKVTTKTLKELDYVYKVRRFCSIQCTYKKGSRKGLPTSLETKAKLRAQKLGVNNPSWRGGVTTLRVSLRNTQEYKEWRKKVYEKDDYTCQWCSQRGGKIQADHIVPYMKDRKQLLDVNNGQVLCDYCHRIKTTIEMKENWVNQYD